MVLRVKGHHHQLILNQCSTSIPREKIRKPNPIPREKIRKPNQKGFLMFSGGMESGTLVENGLIMRYGNAQNTFCALK